LFRVEPLDGRLPALEDGRSWVTLIDHYHLTRFDPGAHLLREKTSCAS
jgi:hypothetical protein